MKVKFLNGETREVIISSCACLRGSDLRGADLYGADLRSAYLRNSDLRYANLRNADLRYADLRYSDLSNADLRGADLCNAILHGAILQGADLRGVLANIGTIGYHNIIPPGAQTVYKKAGGRVVTLELFHDSKRSNATTRKCRVSKALVKAISGGRTDVSSDYDDNFVYRVGEVIEVTNFDEDRWNECAPGIHCFLTVEEAEDY